MNQPRILIVDDEENLRFTLSELMTKEGYLVATAVDGFNALEIIKQNPFDVILLDIKMPKIDGLQTLIEIKKIDPDAVVIMMTAFETKPIGYQAIDIGAYDFFPKPFDINEMRVTVRRAIERSRMLKELQLYKQQEIEYEKIIGTSSRMKEVYRLISQVSKLDVTVLIIGESGTGKELVAQAIHNNSYRKDKPFVKMNCVAIPEGLLESELFGHERGAFTGASERRLGKFEIAKGGTIFLDEIGDMTLPTQAKLLRVLQEREFERVGGNNIIKVDVRVIAATNKDLVKATEEKSFREDLYFRLNVISIFLPPLRERKEDLPLLFEYFRNKYNKKFGKNVQKLSSPVLNFIQEYSWPGNVREFENFIQRSIALSPSNLIEEDAIPVEIKQGNTATPTVSSVSENEVSLSEHINNITAEAERRIISKALQNAGGNRSAAAKALGLSRKSLYDKLAKYNISD
jgi:two-component system response regulator AtoC